jgi:hypothetical protein
MVRGAIHPNVDNWRRASKLDIVARMRRLVDQKMYERPAWLTACERIPPMELHNLHMNTRLVRNPYPKMLEFLLRKYPQLRFQDCFVDGNDWSPGNDTFNDDHPAMQFVAWQLKLMNQGMSKPAAFKAAEKRFRERRLRLEREHKILMAMARDNQVEPMFTSGHAYWHAELAKNEQRHLESILYQLRNISEEAGSTAGERAKMEAKTEAERRELVRRALPRAPEPRGDVRGDADARDDEAAGMMEDLGGPRAAAPLAEDLLSQTPVTDDFEVQKPRISMKGVRSGGSLSAASSLFGQTADEKDDQEVGYRSLRRRGRDREKERQRARDDDRDEQG